VEVWRARYEGGQALDASMAEPHVMETARLVRVKRAVVGNSPVCETASYAAECRASGALTQFYNRGTKLPGEYDLGQALIPGARAFALVEIVRVRGGVCAGSPRADSAAAAAAASDVPPVLARAGGGAGGGEHGAGDLVIMRVPVRARSVPRWHVFRRCRAAVAMGEGTTRASLAFARWW
jgi:hypothetical protein